MVNLESILLGEDAENELRKDFTKSERYAIAKQIEALLGERRGRPSEKNVENSPHFELGTKTRDVTAEKAGFGNRMTYRQAKQVVEEGSDAVRNTM